MAFDFIFLTRRFYVSFRKFPPLVSLLRLVIILGRRDSFRRYENAGECPVLWPGMNAAISKIRWAGHFCPAAAFLPRLESLGYPCLHAAVVRFGTQE